MSPKRLLQLKSTRQLSIQHVHQLGYLRAFALEQSYEITEDATCLKTVILAKDDGCTRQISSSFGNVMGSCG